MVTRALPKTNTKLHVFSNNTIRYSYNTKLLVNSGLSRPARSARQTRQIPIMITITLLNTTTNANTNLPSGPEPHPVGHHAGAARVLGIKQTYIYIYITSIILQQIYIYIYMYRERERVIDR